MFRGISRASELANEKGSMAHLPQISLGGQCTVAENQPCWCRRSGPVHCKAQDYNRVAPVNATFLPVLLHARILTQRTEVYSCSKGKSVSDTTRPLCICAVFSISLCTTHGISRDIAASFYDAR